MHSTRLAQAAEAAARAYERAGDVARALDTLGLGQASPWLVTHLALISALAVLLGILLGGDPRRLGGLWQR